MTLFLSKRNRGFTLIELLVVIAIIGVLTSVVLVSLNIARSKARDARRKSDIHEIEKALAIYYIDHDEYPNTSLEIWGISDLGGNHTTSGINAYIPGLTPIYITELPVDPLGDTTGWSGYIYRSDGANYKLIDHYNGPESMPSPGEPFYDPIRPDWAWMVCSAEPACSNW